MWQHSHNTDLSAIPSNRTSRKTLKKELECDQIEEFYLTTNLWLHKYSDSGLWRRPRLDSGGTMNSVSRGTNYANAPYAIIGSSDSPQTGHAVDIQRHFSTISARTMGVKTTARSTVEQRKDETIGESVRCTCPLCYKERWQVSKCASTIGRSILKQLNP